MLANSEYSMRLKENHFIQEISTCYDGWSFQVNIKATLKRYTDMNGRRRSAVSWYAATRWTLMSTEAVHWSINNDERIWIWCRVVFRSDEIYSGAGELIRGIENILDSLEKGKTGVSECKFWADGTAPADDKRIDKMVNSQISVLPGKFIFLRTAQIW